MCTIYKIAILCYYFFMNSPNFDRAEKPSTPEQSRSIQDAIKQLTEGQTLSPYSDRLSVSLNNLDTPKKVDEHLPPAGIGSFDVSDSAFISYLHDWKTGEPITDGVIGMASFSRRDEVTPGLIYAGHVNYHITHQDGEYGIERHVTNTEHGSHMVGQMLGRTARYATNPASQLLDLLELKARLDESRPMEKALGMFDVSASEAEDVVQFLSRIQ
jgi:hypothetical protein